MSETALLEVKDLKTYFHTKRGIIKAVDGVNFSLKRGETLGLVGESGSGKSITCLSILRLVAQPAGQIVSGQIIFDGEDLLAKSEREMKSIRGRQISMILQDPMRSLNPVFTIGEQVAEPIRIHQRPAKRVLWDKVTEILDRVKIPLPTVRIGEYPHQMSGGMRQRIVGAMALSCRPLLLIADEPTTALDVTIQAQFLKLIKEIQQDLQQAMIMVTHDLGIVAKVCDRVAVMYAGRIVEIAGIRELFSNPQHPYTIALMESRPKLQKTEEQLFSIKGQPPSLGNLPSGCAFAPRCRHAMEVCHQVYPPMVELEADHTLSCWLFNDEENT